MTYKAQNYIIKTVKENHFKSPFGRGGRPSNWKPCIEKNMEE
nr:MAG TPA: hypothetical protein [Siphoviridae sp. ctnoo6]